MIYIRRITIYLGSRMVRFFFFNATVWYTLVLIWTKEAGNYFPVILEEAGYFSFYAPKDAGTLAEVEW